MRRARRTKRRCRAGLPWTEEEQVRLTRLYPTNSNREVAARLRRSEWSIVGKARALGLKRNPAVTRRGPRDGGEPWSHRETELLKMLYPVMPYEDVADELGRTHDAVKMKARRLKLRKMEFWTEAEDRLLKDSYKNTSWSQIAQRLGRTLLAVKARAITLGLEAKMPNWTQSDTCLLKKSYQSVSLQTIARELDRTPKATAKKARQMGLVRYRHWSRDDLQKLSALYPQHSVHELADRLGRSPDAVKGKVRELELREDGVSVLPRGFAPGSPPRPETTEDMFHTNRTLRMTMTGESTKES